MLCYRYWKLLTLVVAGCLLAGSTQGQTRYEHLYQETAPPRQMDASGAAPLTPDDEDDNDSEAQRIPVPLGPTANQSPVNAGILEAARQDPSYLQERRLHWSEDTRPIDEPLGFHIFSEVTPSEASRAAPLGPPELTNLSPQPAAVEEESKVVYVPYVQQSMGENVSSAQVAGHEEEPAISRGSRTSRAQGVSEAELAAALKAARQMGKPAAVIQLEPGKQHAPGTAPSNVCIVLVDRVPKEKQEPHPSAATSAPLAQTSPAATSQSSTGQTQPSSAGATVTAPAQPQATQQTSQPQTVQQTPAQAAPQPAHTNPAPAVAARVQQPPVPQVQPPGLANVPAAPVVSIPLANQSPAILSAGQASGGLIQAATIDADYFGEQEQFDKSDDFIGPIWSVGVEATFLGPSRANSNASLIFRDLGAGDENVFVADDVNSFFVAPRMWLGFQGCRWGIVARYWHLRNSAKEHDPFVLPLVVPPTEYGHTTHDRLEAYVIDLEVTRSFCIDLTKMTLSFGARYGSLEDAKSVFGFAAIDDDILTGTAHAMRAARGTGLTLGLNARRPLFCNSCAQWFGSVRVSTLWGPSEKQVETTAQIWDPFGSAGSFNQAFSAVNETIFIGEVQLGVQWDYPLKCLPADAFLRLAGEYQYWDAGGGFAIASSNAGQAGVSRAITNASAGPMFLNLVGFSVAAGFTW